MELENTNIFSIKIRNGKVGIKPSRIVWCIVLLPFLLPPNVWSYIGGYRVQYYSQMIAILGIAASILLHLKDLKKEWIPIFWISVFDFTYVLSTVVNRGNVFSAVLHFTVLTLLFFLITICINDKAIAIDILIAIRDITLLFFVINLILVIIFPNGIARFESYNGIRYWLYGNNNAIIRKILPGLVSTMVIDKINGRLSYKTVFYWIGIFFQLLFVYFSASTFVAMIFVLIWCKFEKPVAKHYRVIYLIVLLIVAFFEFNIVINGTGGAFRNTITDILGKSSNFTGREYLWKRAIISIAGQPILGYGHLADEYIAMYIGNRSGAHNYYLDIAFQRGLIGVVSLLIVLLMPFIRIRKNSIPKTKEGSSVFHILFGFTCSIYIMFLIEPFFSSEYLILPIIFASLAYLNREYRYDT